MKKKTLALALVFIMILSLLPVGAFAVEQIKEGKEKTVVFSIDKKNYNIGDKTVETDVEPYIKNVGDGTTGGRTMVPVAFVAPALGTEPAVWNPESRMVTIKKGSKNIIITIGSKELLVNGKKIMMDVAAEIKNVGNGGGRTMLPIAFIARALEVGYEWDGVARSVSFYGYTKTYDQKGTFGPASGLETIEGSVVVKADGVTLQNIIVKGNLTIAEEVGHGDVTLNNIIVKGETNIRGGGKDSIHINGGQYKSITIQNIDGKVRIVAKGINNLDVIISEDAKGQEIILEGNFKSVVIESEAVNITTQGKTTIKELIVAESSSDTILNLGKDTDVNKMELNSDAEVKGTGIIKDVDINANGVRFEKAPDKHEIAEGIDAPIIVNLTPAPSTGGGGGSSGSTSVAVSAITVTGESDATEVVNGGTLQMRAAVTPSNATNKTISWTVSPVTGTATIGAGGLLIGTGEGTVVVTASSVTSGVTGIAEVTVITVDKTALTAAITAEVGADHETPVYVLLSTDYTVATWTAYANAITTAIAVEANVNAVQSAVDAAVTPIGTAKAALVFANKAAMDAAVIAAGAKVEGDYSAASWSLFTSAKTAALLLPANTNAEMGARTTALNNAMALLVYKAPEGLTALPGNTEVQLSWSAAARATSYKVYRSTTSGEPYDEIATGITSTTYKATGLTNGTTYYFVVKGTYESKDSSYSNEVSAMPAVFIMSKTITNFNFGTVSPTQAKLTSKSITSADFSGANKKLFTINDGKGNTVVVDLSWNIPYDPGYPLTAAQRVGSGIDSYIQMHFSPDIMSRTLSAASWGGDTLDITTFATGGDAVIQLGGNDWSYFFNTSTANGSWGSNRHFTVSDGTKTATISLTQNLSNIDGVVTKINTYLTGASLNAVAEKISDSQFRIRAITGDINLTISGTHKTEFFD